MYDEKLVCRFHLLGDDESGVLCTPPVYIAFDVLQVGQRDLRGRPLCERRDILEDLLADVDMVLPCRQLPKDGAEAWSVVQERGFEGMVAKDPRSTYRSGPTRSWVKVKVRHENVFVVGGIRNVDAFDGVLVGELADDRLEYRGCVEWGYRAADEGRVVYLTPELKAGLAAQVERVRVLERKLGRIIPYLFPHLGLRHQGKRIHDFRKAWATACKRAGVVGRFGTTSAEPRSVTW